MRKTGVFKSEVFLAHDPGHGHVESPARLAGIYGELVRPENTRRFVFPDFAAAGEEILALNHSRSYIARVAATAGKTFEVLDPDTHTSPRSYEAACLAVGAVVRAVEMVAAGGIDNAFVLLRPPGHHAEADHSSGFCLFNNVAVAARHAIQNLGLGRVLVFDWDLHHGNGTQHSFYDSDRVLYLSTHQYPCFPGSGSLRETGQGKGEGFTVNVPLPGGQGDADFARIVAELVAPVARQYRPEMLIVSAGYDIHVEDPLGSMAVTEAGFADMTRQLVDLALEICGGRLLLVLEGGYNLGALKRSILATLAELAGDGILGTPYLTQRVKYGVPRIPLPALEQAKAMAGRYWRLG